MSTTVHRYNSYGRTRQPKNMAGAHEAEIAATVPTAAPSGATAGVSTENQRYLHIFLKNSEAAKAKEVTVWGYIHAFGEWFQLKNTAGTAIVVTLGSGVGTKVFQVHEIAGVDRVYFQSTDSSNNFVAGDTAMAAGSTFQGS